MRLLIAAAAAALALAGPAGAAPQPSPATEWLKQPCPSSGFQSPMYASFLRNGGDPVGYYEVATACVGKEVRAAAEAIGMGRTVPLGVKNLLTMMFTAEGTFAVDGRTPVAVHKLDFQADYGLPAGRLLIQRTPGQSDIRAFNEGRAWNEASEGRDATPAAAGQAAEREAIAKLTPYGAIWSVVEAEGTTTVAQVNGKTVLSGTSPYDGLPVTVTLDAENRPESMTLRSGANTYGASFADYRGDLEPDYWFKFPRRITWTKNGRPFADLTVTYYRSNPYVMFPLPEAVKSQPVQARRKRISPSEGYLALQKPTTPTPRLPDGKPDFNGVWLTITNPYALGANFGVAIRRNGAFEADQGAMQRAFTWNKPMYKPEYWEKVRSLDFSKVDVDPVSHCRPTGVPRQGPPAKIIQTANEITLVQNPSRARYMPLDGRGHREVDFDQSFYDGVPAASWDGDTLVVKSVGFNDISWLQWQGYFHTDRMEVTERLRRQGNLLFYTSTVDDPDVLAQPWTSDTYIAMLSPDPYAALDETLPCEWEDPVGDLYLRG